MQGEIGHSKYARTLYHRVGGATPQKVGDWATCDAIYLDVLYHPDNEGMIHDEYPKLRRCPKCFNKAAQEPTDG